MQQLEQPTLHAAVLARRAALAGPAQLPGRPVAVAVVLALPAESPLMAAASAVVASLSG